MKKIQLEIDLILQGPILTHTEESMGLGLDMVSRTQGELPVINGSLLRGNLLHILNYFNSSLGESNDTTLDKNIFDWFGSGSSDKDYAPMRGNLTFDYFWRSKQPTTRKRRFRIGINDETGTVQPGNLQVIQAAYETGEEAKFSGRVQAWVTDDEEEKNLKYWLDKALQYLSSMGALKGVGYGKLMAHCIHQVTQYKQKSMYNLDEIIDQGSALTLEVELELDRPFCIAQPHLPNSNRFISENFISGSVLKGALARQWKLTHDNESLDRSELFTNLRFIHAQPGHKDKPRGLPLPLSLVYSEGQFIDAALHRSCFMLEKNTGNKEQLFAPAFSTDWKRKIFEKLDKKLLELGYPHYAGTHRLLTVRTAIDADVNAAEKGKLFSLECVDPGFGENNTLWKTRLHIPKKFLSVNKPHIRKLLQEITQNGLTGIGKTKANAKVVNIQRIQSDQQGEINTIEDYYIIMLSSQARLLPANHSIPATGGNQHLHDQYCEYFEHASSHTLTLSHFYAQQSLYGGEFYWRNYRQHESCYQPEWMTEPGSVFVLKTFKGKDEEALGKLKNWCEAGLPVAKDRQNDNWQTDPLIAQNGYGEIVVNHSIHSQLQHPEEGKLIFCESEVSTNDWD